MKPHIRRGVDPWFKMPCWVYVTDTTWHYFDTFACLLANVTKGWCK